MMKYLAILFLLAVAPFAYGQDAKDKPIPEPEPTFSTTRAWRTVKDHPEGGHKVYFYDHAKYKLKMAAMPKRFINVGALPPSPAEFDWGKGLVYGMDGNDRYGDCFYAYLSHHDNTLTGTRGSQSKFSLGTFSTNGTGILNRYRALSGGDNGLSDQDVQDEWRGRYIADIKEAKAVDFLYLDTTNPASISPAMYHFGGCAFTFTVANQWMNMDPGSIWDASTYRANNNGHAVYWSGVQGGNYKVITWAVYYLLTPAGVKVCEPSGFVVFSPRWFDAKGYCPTGKHITELAQIWVAAGGKTIPAAVINAFPPPSGPTPPPGPLPPTPSGAIITLSKDLKAGSYEIHPTGTKAKLDAIQKLLDELRPLNSPLESSAPPLLEKKSGYYRLDESGRLVFGDDPLEGANATLSKRLAESEARVMRLRELLEKMVQKGGK